jgi:hypothetical protein
MSKRLGTVVAVVAVMTSQVGCYTTKVVSQARPDGPAYTDRQWFTIGGLVPLSGPAGRECENGLSAVESKMSGTDWLINAGLGIAGGIVGGLACGGATNDPNVNFVASASCSLGFSTLVPFLISSRTVEYSCAEGYGGGDNRGGGRLDYMPPRQGYRVAPQQEGAPAEAPPAQTP